MKHIGIVVAVSREFKSFLEDSSFKVEVLQIKNHEVYKTSINSNEIFFIQSGWGEIDASSATELLIAKFDCDYILNYGVVGALTRDLKVNELLVVKKVVHYDLDTSSIDQVKPGQYSDLIDEYIPSSIELYELAIKTNPKLKSVICASGDKFIDDKKFKKELHTKFKADICDMEVAGIYRTCFKSNIKALSIKCISDVYDGDGKDFAQNVESSGKIAFDFLKDLLFKL